MDPINQSHLLKRIEFLEKENSALRARLEAENDFPEATSLHDENQLLRHVLDSIPVGITCIAPDHTVQVANQAICRLLDLPLEQIVGRKCHDLFKSNEGLCKNCHAPINADNSSASSVCTAHLLSGNQTTTVQIRIIPVPETHGAGMMQIIEDISAQERVEHEKMLLAELIENAEHVAVFKDADLRYVTVNKAYLHLTGFTSRTQVIGKTDVELFSSMSTPEEILKYMENDRRAFRLAPGENLTVEETTQGEDGSLRTFLTKKFPVFSTDGTCLGVATLASEITARKRAEEALLQANRQLHAFFENIPGHINVVDREYNIIGVSRGLLDNFGFKDSGGIIGKKCYKVLQGQPDVCSHCSLPQALEQNTTVVRYSTPEEEILTGKSLKIYCAPIKDEDGAIIGGMEFVADISDLRSLEQELITARDAAEKASLAKSEFLANMSHEVRTPLNGVLGMLQLLEESELDEQQMDFVQTALTSSRTLLEVINDILDISKIEAGKLELEEWPFSLQTTLNHLRETFIFQAREKGIDITVNVSPNVPELVLGDQRRLRQVFFNLVGNAVKFTDAGRVQMEADVLYAPHAATNSRLILSCAVRDTGIGIPKEDIERLFEPFTQRDASYSRRFQGTGLGLAIVRKLVELMHGEVFMESEEGVGTTVHFTVEMKQTSIKQLVDACEDTGASGKRHLKVLLAEDNMLNQSVAVHMLSKLGHEYVAVENGQQVLEALKRESFDVVLMDIQMPRMSGLDATKHIRKDTSGALPANIPIIAMTAHSMKGDQDAFLAAGMDGFLPKPIELPILEAILRNLAL